MTVLHLHFCSPSFFSQTVHQSELTWPNADGSYPDVSVCTLFASSEQTSHENECGVAGFLRTQPAAWGFRALSGAGGGGCPVMLAPPQSYRIRNLERRELLPSFRQRRTSPFGSLLLIDVLNVVFCFSIRLSSAISNFSSVRESIS